MPRGEEVKVGFYVTLTGDSTVKGKLFKVSTKEPFTFETGDEKDTIFSAVTSGSTSGGKNVDQLEPDSGQIAYYDWGVQDGCRYQMKVKPGSSRLGPQQEKEIGYVDNMKSPYCAPNPRYGFWLFDDWYPSVDAKNVTPYSVTPKVWFEGFKFDVQEITDPAVKKEIIDKGKFSILPLGGVEK